MNSRRQLVIAVVAAVVVGMLFFVFLLKPKMAEIADTRDRVEAARDEGRSLQNEITRLQEARKHSTTTDAKLAKVSRFLPDTPDLPSFIRLIQAAANASSIELESIAPSPPSDLEGSQGIQVISVNLSVHGGFFRIEDLLARIEKLKRVVEVRSISLTPTTDELSSQTVLDATLTCRMYVVQPNARYRPARASGGARPSPSPSAEASP